MVTKEVLIHIRGVQNMGGITEQDEPIELITPGEYYFRNNTHYLLYEERMEGFTEPVHNMVKFRPGMMEVRKKGLVSVHMIFEKDKKNMSLYKTPMGTIQMEIAATCVTLAEASEWMELRAEYALCMNGNSVADCTMNIRVTPKGNKEAAVFFT